ncbi:MAG: universal stress protein [Bacteroidales bacterium]|nr:universal stress protein [Bacteroidales bacterium]
MKRLVVAFDFSKNSEHALEYALVYAQKLSAALELVWIDNSVSSASLVDTIEEELRIEKKNFLKDLVKKYESEYPDIPIKINLGKGKVYQEVSKIALRLKADLIFTGTHGISGYEQFWIGSNAFRITTSAPCPVVTVQCNYTITPNISDILLPLDSSLETKKKLPFTVQLAKQFGAKIHLLKIYNSTLGVIRRRIDSFGDEALTYLKDSGVEYELCTREAGNVATSIIEYADNHNIDLITIMTDQETTTGSRFLGPYSQQLIHMAKMPVMSLRANYYSQDEDMI